jgi:regulator of sirC expression with transglutaminase-like and TPR domain
MYVEELWSEADEARAARLLAARDASDLVGALLAIEGAGEDAAATDLEKLDTWALHVRSRAPGDPPGDAAALAEVLGGELGFRGDTSDYDSPINSHLHRVIERRRGLPILLSVVWIEVGTRAGLRVEGVGLPGHFVVRVGGPGGVYADPFHGGRILGEAECRRIAREATGGASFRAAWLAEATVLEILERVLRNLASSARARQDGAALYRAVSLLAVLQPDRAGVLLERAQVAHALGAFDLARAHATELLRRFPGTPEAGAARAVLQGPATTVLH